NTNHYTYLTFNENFDARRFSEISDDFYSRYMADFGDQFGQSSRFLIEPLTDIHLYSTTNNDQPRGNIYYVISFAVIGTFVLIIACVNYINLATARSFRKIREVAIRKLLGAEKKRLTIQFLAESLLLSSIAVAIGLSLVEALIAFTPLESFLGKEISLTQWGIGALVVGSVLLAALIGLISGIYPALYISGTKPVATLKQSESSANSIVRQLLVLTQFTVSVSVISCALLMYMQMQYVNTQPLGFEKENKIVLDVRGAEQIESLPIFTNEIRTDPDVLETSTVFLGIPGGRTSNRFFSTLDENGEPENYSFFNMHVDFDFLDLMEIELVAGRGFDRNISGDVANSVLINEKMVQRLGWDQPLGKVINPGDRDRVVVGVVKDFHFQRLQNEIEPLVIFPDDQSESGLFPVERTQLRQLIISLSGTADTESLDYIRDRWQEFDPLRPFEYEFLENSLNELYTSSQQQMVLIGAFSLASILISCLGLYGLTAFTMEQRTKEIGIRKTLGASTVQIILMLFRNILKLILYGSVIAAFISFLAMTEWLQGFYYHTEINLFVFFLSSAIALAIAFVTVALQSRKTAQANPIEALRYE
ncbi:MAG: FtsX-like permease family protein, partial [Pseudomonadales bacterium]|nr:FtsX-like permease family protein [Pseudomonadales bacterium]